MDAAFAVVWPVFLHVAKQILLNLKPLNCLLQIFSNTGQMLAGRGNFFR